MTQTAPQSRARHLPTTLFASRPMTKGNHAPTLGFAQPRDPRQGNPTSNPPILGFRLTEKCSKNFWIAIAMERNLVEGSSMRSISRVVGVSINTVTKLLVDAGTACAAYHDERVRGVTASRIQCDEIWSFCYAKAKNVARAKAAPEDAGDVWTWSALDSDSKLIVSWLVGGRDSGYAIEFMDDLRSRLENLTTDGHKAYLEAVEGAFGGDVDYAQLVKLYGEPQGAGARAEVQPVSLPWRA